MPLRPRRAVMRPLPVMLARIVVALAPPLAARPPLPEGKGHDLRGPALKKGLKLTVKTTITLKDADLESRNGVKRKLNVVRAEELEVELAAVKGRQPTRINTKVVKAESTQT